jgi:hypothetical protein
MAIRKSQFKFGLVDLQVSITTGRIRRTAKAKRSGTSSAFNTRGSSVTTTRDRASGTSVHPANASITITGMTRIPLSLNLSGSLPIKLLQTNPLIRPIRREITQCACHLHHK